MRYNQKLWIGESEQSGVSLFTELAFANGKRKAHLIAIIDHVSKMAYGWALQA